LRDSPALVYLHGFCWLDPHHCHREAPPDQHEAGRSLRLGVDGAGCAGSEGDGSATFGASMTFGGSMTGGASTTLGVERATVSLGGLAGPLAASIAAGPPDDMRLA